MWVTYVYVDNNKNCIYKSTRRRWFTCWTHSNNETFGRNLISIRSDGLRSSWQVAALRFKIHSLTTSLIKLSIFCCFAMRRQLKTEIFQVFTSEIVKIRFQPMPSVGICLTSWFRGWHFNRIFLDAITWREIQSNKMWIEKLSILRCSNSIILHLMRLYQNCTQITTASSKHSICVITGFTWV